MAMEYARFAVCGANAPRCPCRRGAAAGARVHGDRAVSHPQARAPAAELPLALSDRAPTSDALRASARDGRRALRTMQPHVIVCDLGMPGETGYDFIRADRSRRCGAKTGAPPSPHIGERQPFG